MPATLTRQDHSGHGARAQRHGDQRGQLLPLGQLILVLLIKVLRRPGGAGGQLRQRIR